jgi:hypothetical protein
MFSFGKQVMPNPVMEVIHAAIQHQEAVEKEKEIVTLTSIVHLV